MSNDHLSSANGLYFPPDVEWMRTPLRDSALAFIHKTALELAGDRVKAAEVMITGIPEEEGSETLDLVLTLDSDWNFIAKLRYDILVKVCERDAKLTEDEWKDLTQKVLFTLLPVNL